jgi:hypothetical protein
MRRVCAGEAMIPAPGGPKALGLPVIGVSLSPWPPLMMGALSLALCAFRLGANARSVREEHWQLGGGQDVAGGTAEDHLS